MTQNKVFPSILLALAAIGLGACSTPYLEGTLFNVHSEGADMPVWVRGQVASGTAIIHLHGGPGNAGGLMYASQPAFKSLESRYAMVYFDQRYSGSTHGNPPDSGMNVGTFASDLKAVLAVVQARFNFTSVFLLGHSWGGALGTAALSDPAFQAKIKGWIEVDGAHNIVLQAKLSRQWVIDYATGYLADSPLGGDASYWRAELDWYAANPIINFDGQVRNSININKAGGYGDSNDGVSEVLGMLWFSPASLALAQNSYLPMRFDLSSLDLSVQLGTIVLPTLLIWGMNDRAAPMGLAQDAYDKLGTPVADKRIVLFAGSGHSPMIDEADKFVATVSEFIETYK